MKICFLADARSGHVYRWIKYFAKSYEIDLVTLSYTVEEEVFVPEQEYKDLGVRVHKISKKFPELLFAPLTIRRLIKRIKPDIVHAHYATQYGFCAAFSNFHPYIMTIWGSDVLLEPKNNFLLKCLVKKALKDADVITCNGMNFFPAIKDLGGREEKIHIIHHGVDTTFFNPDTRDRQVYAHILPDLQNPIIIDVRGFRSVYNAETMIRAIPSVLEEFPEAKFIMVGEGEDKKQSQDLAISLGVSDAVFFVSWIPHEELPPFLSSADVYVSTSLSDGGAVVSTLEAMASGLPVVVTDSGDHALWVNSGENGFVIPKKDSDALARKLVYLLQNDEIRIQFGRRSRFIVEDKAEYNIQMGKMDRIYNSLGEK